MLFEYLIIIAYFFASAIPVATVVVFFMLQANPETADLIPEADTYRMPDDCLPDESEPKQLEA